MSDTTTDTLQSLEKSFWDSDTGRAITGCLGPYKEYRDILLIGAILFVIIFPFVCLKAMNLKHVDKDIGYEIKGPSWWHMSVTPDQMHVKFEKHQNRRSGNSIIKADIDISNPYGTTLDYISMGVLPKVVFQYQKAGITAEVQTPAYAMDYKGQEWATASLSVGDQDIQTFFVTFFNDHVLILSLYSPVREQAQNEKLVNQTLKSLKVYKLEHRNQILENFK